MKGICVFMEDTIREYEIYQEKRREYLLNKKPERYMLFLSFDGFTIEDTIGHRNFDGGGYMYFPDFMSDTKYRKVDERYKSIEELVTELNMLDFQVNGNLYDDYYHVLSNKDRLHSELNNRVDMALNNLIATDSFDINFIDYDKDSPEAIGINVNVYRKDFENMLDDINHEDNLKSNVVEWAVMNVIDEYLDELGTSRDDLISKDTLLELKWKLLNRIKLFKR